MEKGKNVETEQIITYNDDLNAPIEQNEVIGKIEILNKETKEVIGQTNILSNNFVEKSNLIDYLKYVFEKFLLKK